jgi:hypothetical protein
MREQFMDNYRQPLTIVRMKFIDKTDDSIAIKDAYLFLTKKSNVIKSSARQFKSSYNSIVNAPSTFRIIPFIYLFPVRGSVVSKDVNRRKHNNLL